LHSIAFGNGSYVAVGTGNLLVSQDAAHWSLKRLDPGITADRVAYLNGQFIATAYGLGGTQAFLLTSIGADTWTKAALPNSPLDYGFSRVDRQATIGFGNGRYVISTMDTFSVGPQQWSSTDSVTWVLRPRRNSDRHMTSIAYGRGIFVGSWGSIYFSTDGFEWMPTARPGDGVIFAQERFLSIGPEHSIQHSYDGLHWDSALIPVANQQHALSYGNGIFVSVGDYGTVLVSSDTTNWVTVATPTANDLYAVCYGPNGFVAVGQGGTIVRSTNGLDWTSAADGGQSPIFGLAEGNGVKVAVGWMGSILSCTNGSNWDQVAIASSETLLAATFAENQFVAVGTGGTIVSSSNGIAWAFRTSGVENTLRSIIYANGYFVVAADNAVLKSSDAVVWNRYLVGQGTNFIIDLCYTGDRFVGVCDNGRLFASPNGESWEAIPAPGSILPSKSIAYGNGRFVVPFSDGYSVAVSGDGSFWSFSFVYPYYVANLSVRSVRFVNGVFVAVGDRGLVATSSDGTHWSREDTGMSQDLYCVAGSSNLFAAGEANAILLPRNTPAETPHLGVTFDTGFHLSLTANSNTTLRLQYSPDLKAWTDLFDVAVGTRGIAWSLQDDAEARFFRAVVPPPPPPSIAGKTLVLTPNDGYGSHDTIRIMNLSQYSAAFNDGTTEEGAYGYTPSATHATLVLWPDNGSGISTITINFDPPGSTGTYTSDTVGTGTFALQDNP